MLHPTMPVTKPATACPQCMDALLNTMATMPHAIAISAATIPAMIQKNGRIMASTQTEEDMMPTLIDAIDFPFDSIKSLLIMVYFMIAKTISQAILTRF